MLITSSRAAPAQRVKVVDSHTGGEPTRVAIDGLPDLGSGPLNQRLHRMRTDYDHFRSALVNEPRGSDVVVGALLLEPSDPSCIAAVIFFNNVGYLGMCGHGTMGLIATLAYLGRIRPGTHRIETPVGVVTGLLHDDGSVSLTNVPSYRLQKDLEVDVPGLGRVQGDVAWGGNWFFLSEYDRTPLHPDRVNELSDYAWRLRQAVNHAGFAQVDHIELFGPPSLPNADAKNFVLCPGKAYDRSPCGTGTSAKLACLADDGKLAEHETWVQESIVGSTFTGRYERHGDLILPTITGTAFVDAEATLLFDEKDPFCWGIRR